MRTRLLLTVMSGPARTLVWLGVSFTLASGPLTPVAECIVPRKAPQLSPSPWTCLARGILPSEVPDTMMFSSLPDDTIPGPGVYPPYTPVRFDPQTQTETVLPLPPGFVEDDSLYFAGSGDASGCLPDTTSGSSPALAVAEAFALVLVEKTTDYPHSAIGLLRCEYPNKAVGWGTGTLINDRHVLTCMHTCFHRDFKPEERMMTGATFYPGATNLFQPNPAGGPPLKNDHAFPYGGIRVDLVYFWKGFTEKNDDDYDMALLTLDDPIGDKVGWLGTQTGGSDVDALLHLSAYPGNKPRHEQWRTAGDGKEETKHLLYSEHASVPGMSGAGPYRKVEENNVTIRYVRAVHAGFTRSKGLARNVRLNRGKFDQVWKWIADDASGAPDRLAADSPCSGCGPDCNGNAVPDSIDIASGMSADVNLNSIPDECEPDVVEPADGLVLSGAPPALLYPDTIYTMGVRLTRGSIPLPNRFIYFAAQQGNVRFVNGLTWESDSATMCVTDVDGIARASFRSGLGPLSIRAQSYSPVAPVTVNSSAVLDVNDGGVAGLRLALAGPWPNPAVKGEVRFDLAMPRAGRVRADLLDVSGRRVGRVADEYFAAGSHSLVIEPRLLSAQPAGTYFLRVTVGEHVLQGTLVHLR